MIDQLAAKLPGPWGAVIGIPRGGLIVASLLGYVLGVDRVAAHGQDYFRRRGRPPLLGIVYCRFQAVPGERVLIVEDGVNTGTLIESACRWYQAEHAHVTTAAVWVKHGSAYRPDVWMHEVDEMPSVKEFIR